MSVFFTILNSNININLRKNDLCSQPPEICLNMFKFQDTFSFSQAKEKNSVRFGPHFPIFLRLLFFTVTVGGGWGLGRSKTVIFN